MLDDRIDSRTKFTSPEGPGGSASLCGHQAAADVSRLIDLIYGHSVALEWHRPLRRKTGSRTRLRKVRVYYDFQWRQVIGHNRSTFRHGQSLADLAIELCPRDLRPCILLTDDESVEVGVLRDDEEFALVVPIKRYLTQSKVDFAQHFFTKEQSLPLLQKLFEVLNSPSSEGLHLGDDEQLDDLSALVRSRPDLQGLLRSLLGEQDGHLDVNSLEVAEIEQIFVALNSLDSGVRSSLIARLIEQSAPDAAVTRTSVLKAITSEPAGRRAAVEAIGSRLLERIADVRTVIRLYREMLEDEHSSETDFQSFIEKHPSLIGLDYVHVRPRWSTPRGPVDFILERFDGFHDVLELKGPNDPIIVAPDAVDGKPPSPSSFSLSPSLANALAQIHAYSDEFTEGAGFIATHFGLTNTRNPGLVIIIGQARKLADHQIRVLNELRRSLHNLEIVTYDQVADRAEAILDQVERYLLLAEPNVDAVAPSSVDPGSTL